MNAPAPAPQPSFAQIDTAALCLDVSAIFPPVQSQLCLIHGTVAALASLPSNAPDLPLVTALRLLADATADAAAELCNAAHQMQDHADALDAAYLGGDQ